jgi:small subunit ribosomal protein S4
MGDPRKLRKKYTSPKHPWEGARLAEEKALVSSFGLRNKKELWRAATEIKRFRYLARKLVGIPIEQRKGEEERLLSKLQKMGLLKEGATLDDALSLKTEDMLARRLQTLTWRTGLATTLSQARQLITHGHITINKRRITSPGAIINAEQEKTIDWYGKPIVVKKPDIVAETPKAEAPKEQAEPKKEKKPRKKKVKEEKEKAPVEVLPSEKIAEEIEKEEETEPAEIKKIEEELDKEGVE